MFEKLPFASASLESWLGPVIGCLLLGAALAVVAPTTGSNTWFLLLPAIPALRVAAANFRRWRLTRSL
jgi:hypothetical protein